LKYLADPKESFGKSETINTFARKGLQADKPDVYKVLKNFHWTKDDMGQVMLDVSNGATPKQAAQKWIKSHQKQVDAWFE